MTKKTIFFGGMLLSLGLCALSCSKSDDGGDEFDAAANLEYNENNAAAWGNYAQNVAKLLAKDASTLYNDWNDGYDGGDAFADVFMKHSGGDYTSASNCIEQILGGCIDIANEVGTAKIGEPYDYFKAGKKRQALYAVESWYSWHSRDDYKNNVKSVANSLMGKRVQGSIQNLSADDAAEQSIVAYCQRKESLKPLADNVLTQTVAAWVAIDGIVQPFRNNIGTPEVERAMDACEALVMSLETLRSAMAELDDEAGLQPVIDTYVNDVVLPTYKELKDRNSELYDAVSRLNDNPSTANFKAACNAWLLAREPWETSEAFLFGPVDAEGLDPNMDSWPLDQRGIVQVLKSHNWAELEYDDNDDDEVVESRQALRGFHTLEFLLFKDGQPRKGL